jgi:hypothetical protein
VRPAALALVTLLALVASCKDRQTQVRLKFPDTPDAGACQAQTNIRCANYIEFSAGTGTGFRSQCTEIDVPLMNLCDVGKIAEGQELFTLSPETVLPIRVEGKRVFPAPLCNSGVCPPKTIFAGQTSEEGPIARFEGQVLEIAVTLVRSCGLPEQFFFLPEGSTCAQLCGSEEEVVCDNVQGGCLCAPHPTPSELAARQAAADGGQQAMDASQ